VRHRPHQLDTPPQPRAEGGGGLKSVDGMSVTKKAQCQRKKMSDSVAVEVMMLNQAQNRMTVQTTTYTPATQLPTSDPSGSIISGLKEASVCMPTQAPNQKPTQQAARLSVRPRDNMTGSIPDSGELPCVCAGVCCPPDCRLPSPYWAANTAPALPYVRRQLEEEQRRSASDGRPGR